MIIQDSGNDFDVVPLNFQLMAASLLRVMSSPSNKGAEEEVEAGQ